MIWQRIKVIIRIARGVQGRIDTANLPLVAAGGAFFAMLSVFPSLAAVITLLGFVADPALVEDQMQMLAEFIPADAYEIISTQVQRMVQTNSSTLGWASALGTLAALWSARKGTDALIRGLNAVYDGPSRSGLHAAALSFGLTVALIFAAVVAILALVIVPLISTILNLPFVAEVVPAAALAWANGVILQLARWGIALAAVFGGVWMLYRFAPNVQMQIKGIITPGSVLSILTWGAATFGFSYYLSNFGNYSKVYGSIGAVVALLMFLYITIYVVLLGAALNAELEIDHDDAAQTPKADDATDTEQTDTGQSVAAASATAQAEPL